MWCFHKAKLVLYPPCKYSTGNLLKIVCYVVRKAVIGGMSSGAIGQFLASPTDLVKVQMQMEGRRILEGKTPRYGLINY